MNHRRSRPKIPNRSSFVSPFRGRTGMSFVDRVRWPVCGKDAGRASSCDYWRDRGRRPRAGKRARTAQGLISVRPLSPCVLDACSLERLLA